jgi:hypothetical protein
MPVGLGQDFVDSMKHYRVVVVGQSELNWFY